MAFEWLLDVMYEASADVPPTLLAVEEETFVAVWSLAALLGVSNALPRLQALFDAAFPGPADFELAWCAARHGSIMILPTFL